jgi:VanZ family protein
VTKTRGLLLYVLPAVLWAAVLFGLSSQSSLPTISTLPQFDKVEHLGAYGILGMLVFRALGAYGVPRRRALGFTFVIGALYGISDEFHQSFTPNRSPEVADAVADAIGSVLGGAGWWVLLTLFKIAKPGSKGAA